MSDSLASRLAQQRLDRHQDTSKEAPSTGVHSEFNAFLSADEAVTTGATFEKLLEAAELTHLQGCGLALYDALKAAVAPMLNFKTGKIFSGLDTRIAAGKALVAGMLHGTSEPPPYRVLICGAGPVGLRSAVEAATLGLDVVVVEKRTAFSRANIITLWDETMADLLSLGGKLFCPNLVSTGNPKHAGTRDMQLILLKNLLLLGGSVRYGMRITGLSSPAAPGQAGRWEARFVPYVRGEKEGAHEMDAAAKALEFQKLKTYEEEFQKLGNKSKLREACDVDPSFLAVTGGDESVAFDAYLIAEGGWSDSTRKLGFCKIVNKRNPTFGLVINMEYDKSNAEEKARKSKLWHTLGSDWPLRECRVLAEFLEYLKGDSHFFAAVVSLENRDQEKTLQYLEQARGTGTLTPEAERALEITASRAGLLEMGVIRAKLPRAQLLQPENVDAEALEQMARLIATECGLPGTTKFCETNPVQIFDFSSLARCEAPLKLLHADGTVGLGTPDEAAKAGSSGAAIVCPIGDALQEPLWTSGLGINRGFHGGLNAVYAALCARHQGVGAACTEMDKAWARMLAINWPFKLAGEGSQGLVKPGGKWTADPKTRL